MKNNSDYKICIMLKTLLLKIPIKIGNCEYVLSNNSLCTTVMLEKKLKTEEFYVEFGFDDGIKHIFYLESVMTKEEFSKIESDYLLNKKEI